MLVAVVALVVVAAGLFVVLRGQSDDDERRGSVADVAAGDRSSTTQQATTTTTAPARPASVQDLFAYCNAPGEAWPEVAAHDPAAPSSTYVAADTQEDPGNGEDRDPTVDGTSDPPEGFTALTPKTDAVFTASGSDGDAAQAAVLAQLRTVVCITPAGVTGTGTTCSYETSFGRADQPDRELAEARWRIEVYELHSGGLLHSGELLTDTSHCPSEVYLAPEDTQVAFRLSGTAVLAWLGSHFVDGQPV